MRRRRVYDLRRLLRLLRLLLGRLLMRCVLRRRDLLLTHCARRTLHGAAHGVCCERATACCCAHDVCWRCCG